MGGFWLFPMMISFPACEGLHQVQSKEKKPQKRKIFFFLCWSRICGSINQSLPKCGLLLRYHYQSRTSTQSTAQWRSTSFTIQDNLFVSPKLITISCVRWLYISKFQENTCNSPLLPKNQGWTDTITKTNLSWSRNNSLKPIRDELHQ